MTWEVVDEFCAYEGSGDESEATRTFAHSCATFVKYCPNNGNAPVGNEPARTGVKWTVGDEQDRHEG